MVVLTLLPLAGAETETLAEARAADKIKSRGTALCMNTPREVVWSGHYLQVSLGLNCQDSTELPVLRSTVIGRKLYSEVLVRQAVLHFSSCLFRNHRAETIEQ
jgi:hypothetical protein